MAIASALSREVHALGLPASQKTLSATWLEKLQALAGSVAENILLYAFTVTCQLACGLECGTRPKRVQSMSSPCAVARLVSKSLPASKIIENCYEMTATIGQPRGNCLLPSRTDPMSGRLSHLGHMGAGNWYCPQCAKEREAAGKPPAADEGAILAAPGDMWCGKPVDPSQYHLLADTLGEQPSLLTHDDSLDADR